MSPAVLLLPPLVRKTILCDKWSYQPPGSKRVVAEGIAMSIRGFRDDSEDAYPIVHPSLSVLVFVTGGQGEGEAFVEIVSEDTGEPVCPPLGGLIRFRADRAAVDCVGFDFSDIVFERPGMYTVRFVFDGKILTEDPLLLR